MAKTLPEFMQRKLSRKTANITRLTDVYKTQVDALANDYQSQFTQYQAKSAETMAPYEAALTKYQGDFSGYEVAASAYKTKLANYTAELEKINADPVVARTVREVTGKTWYGKKQYGDVTYYDPKPIPTFTEKKPDAPVAPVSPVVEAFDTKPFDAKRGDLQNNLNRDLGAVKAARVSAVTRKSSRPMLQGEKP